ncbi:hypothetical protein ACFY2W_10645 [Streptomyces sp. NPDC001262]|uniref:hypothetical protein n=1 Tax=Streptomyces sp. NPDC001262 TaxID=3364552 RepID=UPI0036A9CF34
MSTTTWHPTLYTQVDGFTIRGERISLYTALSAIRKARKSLRTVDTVNVYTCTGRDGTALHIAYIHYAPGQWTDIDDVIDVIEIPTAALTDL